ncbi:hypothetical protein HKX48_004265 [Thoreauomyces humboldtii]|nr:hypothetical protein HKX48_004265 [Thoreauomyces humboldtii]
MFTVRRLLLAIPGDRRCRIPTRAISQIQPCHRYATSNSNSDNVRRPSRLTARNAAKVGALTGFAGLAYYVTRPALPTPTSTSQNDKIPQRLLGEPLSDEHTTAFLRQHERKFDVDLDELVKADEAKKGKAGKRGWGGWFGGEDKQGVVVESAPVLGYHLNQVASNAQVEDYHSENRLSGGVILGVYDGHGGTECAIVLSQYLGAYVGKAISEIPTTSTTPPSPSVRKAQVTAALKTAFERMDADIINGGIEISSNVPYAETLRHALRPAVAGSCAIVAYMEGKDVYVACTGDSRAVIVKRRGDGSLEAVDLSADQTTSNPAEYARLLEEHPDEEKTVVARGRILGGLMPTRAFGDSSYKWLQAEKDALGMRKNAAYLTPPYVTASPEVVHYTLDLSTDKALILATDGIWDCLSSEQAVDLVGGHMQRNKLLPDPPTIGTSLLDPANRAGGDWDWSDDNAATCLIRNAVGRGDPALLAKLVRIPPPHSRRWRDDMTVNVVFFGEDGNSTTSTAKRPPLEGSVNQQQLQGPLEHVDLARAAPKTHRFKQWVQGLQAQQNQSARRK